MSSRTNTEADLLRRCARGEQDALRALYERTAAQLYAIIKGIVVQPALAEEALQETYVRIWQGAGKYRPHRGQPLTWMISIARYRAIDLRRAARPEIPFDESTHGTASAGAAVDPAMDAMRNEDIQALNECMEELAIDQRRSVQLAFLNGYTHVEIARELGTPLGTVKSWIRRGMQALKECLQQ